MRFFEPVRVRFADTDAQGHVFFANYLTFFDEGMTGYLHAIGMPPEALDSLGVEPMYVDAGCSWTGSAKFGDTLQVGCRFSRLGDTSVRAEFAVHRKPGAEAIATGHLVFVMVGPDKAKVAVPQALRDAVERFEA